jgi:hypothetical protein
MRVRVRAKEDRLVRRLAALAAALGMTLMLAAPALAVEASNIPVGGVPSDSTEFAGSDTDCAGVQAGTVLYHFVITNTTSNTQTLTATFENADPQTVSPTKFAEHDSSGVYTVQYDVTVPSPDTLLSASTSGTDGQLVLSHVCDGGPGQEVPEAPASVLLVLTAGLIGLGFAGWKMRRSASAV